MSSPTDEVQDEPMNEENEDVEMGALTDDSSEEEEEDEAEEQRIRQGFIVDEDEEDEEEVEEESRRRRKRRKRHHRREETLEEDDLDLLEENTGTSFKRNRLTRLRRRAVDSDSDDNDDFGQEQDPVGDIQTIFEERDYDDESLHSFITDSDEGEGDEAARKARRAEKRRIEAARRAQGRAHPVLTGIDANAWDEIHEVFGNGDEYDWALAGDELIDEFEETKTKYTDVFEPSQIRDRLLTEDDDLIRAQDIPERMQLSTSSLSSNASLSTHTQLSPDDINGAAMWITMRLSTRKTLEFFGPEGQYKHLQAPLVQAVTFVLKQLFIHEYEVPYIWSHKRDQICYFDIADLARTRSELLSQSELWRIYTLGQKYRSLVARRNALQASYERLRVEDTYFTDEIQPHLDSVEMIADATEWLIMKYKDKKSTEDEFRFHDDEEDPEGFKKPKMPSRISVYEVAKKSVVSKLADGFGIKPTEIVQNFISDSKIVFVEDPELAPSVYAEQFADPDPLKALPSDELLRRARMILSTELGKDPRLRDFTRQIFKEHAYITVEPTPRGIQKIDDHHPYYNFKYLSRKPIKAMYDSGQFLKILAAESELLVTLSIEIHQADKDLLEKRLVDAFSSDGFGSSAQSWNHERLLVVREVVEQHLIPAATKWTREYLREEVEDYLAGRCAMMFRNRVDVAPYKSKDGEPASVVAVSWGKGDPHKDVINIVCLDAEGRMRESLKLDNLFEQDLRDEFYDVMSRRQPTVIVVGGLTMATCKLSHKVKEIVSGKVDVPPPVNGNNNNAYPPPPPPPPMPLRADLGIPVIYVQDDLARIYSNSSRASQEFPAFSTTGKYCVGLARYTQSPLNEFAALGVDITAITFLESEQQLVPSEKLLSAFERVLVDITNKVGVDINRAVADSYYAHLLPFVCGLGPRKAQVLIKKIGALGGSLINRQQFIKSGIMTTKIFLNAVAFLRIAQEDPETAKLIKTAPRRDDDNAADPLDDTRIHPEDYELARKMATDALELDEEDTHDYHPSYVVTQIMADEESDKKLSELNLDDFAISLYDASQEMRRHTLNVIREELLRPFVDQRKQFLMLGAWDVLTMLSGETPKTLKQNLVISATVLRSDRNGASFRLDSGVEGIAEASDVSDQGQKLQKGQVVQAVVLGTRFDVDQDQFEVQLITTQSALTTGDHHLRAVVHDAEYWDYTHAEKEKEMKERKKRAQVDRTRRVIKHPNFHNFNTAQAETYLDKQQRGDVVIRPSSKGLDHLAVTWKVDDKLYQHIDVTELNFDPSGQGPPGMLRVDNTHTYADLDELIVNHVQAMARRVEDLKAHERFKGGSDDELAIWLKQQLAANPGKSMYGFMLNRKRPGHFILGFLANKNASVQTWPVRVAPEAYYLFDAAAVGVPELCDAFKVRHLHETNNAMAQAAAGNKTPYGAGGRTPARPGFITPGHASVRQVGRTPNPYGGATPASHYSATAPGAPYGYQTPRPMGGAAPSNALPHGMNPARAAMIQQSGGWSQSGWS